MILTAWILLVFNVLYLMNFLCVVHATIRWNERHAEAFQRKLRTSTLFLAYVSIIVLAICIGVIFG